MYSFARDIDSSCFHVRDKIREVFPGLKKVAFVGEELYPLATAFSASTEDGMTVSIASMEGSELVLCSKGVSRAEQTDLQVVYCRHDHSLDFFTKLCDRAVKDSQRVLCIFDDSSLELSVNLRKYNQVTHVFYMKGFVLDEAFRCFLWDYELISPELRQGLFMYVGPNCEPATSPRSALPLVDVVHPAKLVGSGGNLALEENVHDALMQLDAIERSMTWNYAVRLREAISHVPFLKPLTLKLLKLVLSKNF